MTTVPISNAHSVLWHPPSLVGVQVIAFLDAVPATSRKGARQTESLERALKGAVVAAATGFAGASAALAEYVDPDDVSDYRYISQ